MGFGCVCGGGVNWPRDPLIHIKFRENGVGGPSGSISSTSQKGAEPSVHERVPEPHGRQGWATGVQAGPPGNVWKIVGGDLGATLRRGIHVC